MNTVVAAIVPEELKVYMSVQSDGVFWSWMALGYIGNATQTGFATKADARAAAEKQKLKPGLVKVWSE